jgi:hypothetical protein
MHAGSKRSTLPLSEMTMSGATGNRRILLYFALVFVGIAIGLAIPTLHEEVEVKPLPVGILTPVPEGEDWVNLLDEEHRLGWGNINDDTEIFEISGDSIHIPGKSLGKLRYVGYETENLGNFELHVEAKISPRGNSGIFLRQQPNDPVYRGFEIQVQDDYGHPPSRNTTGAIYDVVTPMFNMSFPAGKWNSYDISLNHDRVQIIVNGWKVVDTDLSKMDTPLGKFEVAYNAIPLEGTLAFQDHGSEAWYRNIYLKKLPPSPPRETDYVPPDSENASK